MKFLMNGCLLLATADGSTIEMVEEIGQDNMVSAKSTVIQMNQGKSTMKPPVLGVRLLFTSSTQEIGKLITVY